MIRQLAFASLLAAVGCGGAAVAGPVAPSRHTIRSRVPPSADAGTAAEGGSEPLLPPLAAVSDPEVHTSAMPSELATTTFVRNELDAAWNRGAPTRTGIARLAESAQLSEHQSSLILLLPAKVRAMGVDPIHCRLERGSNVTLSCFEAKAPTYCLDRIRVATLRIGDAAIEVVEDSVRTERIDRANGGCGCRTEA